MSMTLRKLNAHAELRRELAKAKQLRDSLRIAAEPGAQVITGLPHAPGYRDTLGGLAAEIVDVTEDIELLEERIRADEPEITAFIDSVTGTQARTIFRLRFLRGLSWAEVAAAIGGRNTEFSVRQVCYRYIAKTVPWKPCP